MTEENKNEKKIIYIITDNMYEEQLTLVKLTREQANTVDWFINKFDINNIDIKSLEEYKCEEP